MAKVSVDGEKVIFEGDSPQEVGQVFDLLMGAMSERGRALVSFLVDGVDLMARSDEDPIPTSFSKIEAFTLTHVELTLTLIERVEEETKGLSDELIAYSRKVLFLGWTEIFSRMDEFVSKIQPIADLVDNLGPFTQTYAPPWRSSFEAVRDKQAEALEEVLGCFRSGNSAGLSDAVAGSFCSMLSDFGKLSTEEIKPDLRKAMEHTA
jgi:hypothetical protein